jgi:hypothetical protein
LPAAEIDPAYADLVPLCREMATRAGPIDAVFVNCNGVGRPARAKTHGNDMTIG